MISHRVTPNAHMSVLLVNLPWGRVNQSYFKQENRLICNVVLSLWGVTVKQSSTSDLCYDGRVITVLVSLSKQPFLLLSTKE